MSISDYENIKFVIDFSSRKLQAKMEKYKTVLSKGTFTFEEGLVLHMAPQWEGDNNNQTNRNDCIQQLLNVIKSRRNPIPYLVIDIHPSNPIDIILDSLNALATSNFEIKAIEILKQSIDLSNHNVCSILSDFLSSKRSFLYELNLILDGTTTAVHQDNNQNSAEILANAMRLCTNLAELKLEWLENRHDDNSKEQNDAGADVPELLSQQLLSNASFFTIASSFSFMTKLKILALKFVVKTITFSQDLLGILMRQYFPSLSNLDEFRLNLFLHSQDDEAQNILLCQQILNDIETGLEANSSCTSFCLEWEGIKPTASQILFAKILQNPRPLTAHLKRLCLECHSPTTFEPHRNDYFNSFMVACQSLESIELLFRKIKIDARDKHRMLQVFAGQDLGLPPNQQQVEYKFMALRRLSIFAPWPDYFCLPYDSRKERPYIPIFIPIAKHCPRLCRLTCILDNELVDAPHRPIRNLNPILERNRLGIYDFMTDRIPESLWCFALERIAKSTKNLSTLYEVVSQKNGVLIPKLESDDNDDDNDAMIKNETQSVVINKSTE